MKNLFEAVDAQKCFTLDEAKVTDYIDADKLGEICSTNPILSAFDDCEPIEGMVLKMTGYMGVSYYKVIKNDDGDFEAYLTDKSGAQLGDPFLLESKVEESVEDGETQGSNFEEDLMGKLRNFVSTIDGIENVSGVDYAPYAANGEYFISFVVNGEEYYIALGSHEE